MLPFFSQKAVYLCTCAVNETTFELASFGLSGSDRLPSILFNNVSDMVWSTKPPGDAELAEGVLVDEMVCK